MAAAGWHLMHGNENILAGPSSQRPASAVAWRGINFILLAALSWPVAGCNGESKLWPVCWEDGQSVCGWREIYGVSDKLLRRIMQ